MNRKSEGFTLIELMVVVVIIAALAAMILPHVLPASEDAKIRIARADIANIQNIGLGLFHLHMDRYPTNEEGLNALISRPASSGEWKGPYLKKRPVDPWKEPYLYRVPGTRNITGGPDVWSKGPDRKEGTSDDVWPEE